MCSCSNSEQEDLKKAIWADHSIVVTKTLNVSPLPSIPPYEGDCHCSGFLSTRTSKLNMRLVQRVHDAVQEFYLARHCYNSTGAVETAATRQHHSSVAANSSFLLPRRLIYKSKTAEQQLNPHQNWRPGIAFADQNKLHYSEIMTGEGAFDGQ